MPSRTLLTVIAALGIMFSFQYRPVLGLIGFVLVMRRPGASAGMSARLMIGGGNPMRQAPPSAA